MFNLRRVAYGEGIRRMWSDVSRRVVIIAEGQPSSGMQPNFLHGNDIVLECCARDDSALRYVRDGRPDLVIEDHPGHEASDPEICARLKGDAKTRSIPLIVVAPRGLDIARDEQRPDATVFKPIVQREYYDAVARFIPLPKRRCLRHSINLRFIYRIDGFTGQAFTRDLSLYGAFLKTDRSIELGTHLEVTFRLPGQAEPLECGAIVRRTAPYAIGLESKAGFAIEFEGLSEDELKRLELFIGRHLDKPLFSS